MTAPDLRALAEAATPGPWGPAEEVNRYDDGQSWWHVDGVIRTVYGMRNVIRCDGDEQTARYIAAVPPEVTIAHLDRIAELETANAALLDEIDALRDVAETALQNTLTVMADDLRLRDADVIMQRNTGSGRERGRADDIDARAADHLEREAEGLTGPRSLR